MKLIDRNAWSWKRLAGHTDPVPHSELSMIGSREWCQLDELGLGWIDARVDTGTRTSALHVTDIRPYRESNQQKVEFVVNPHPQDNDASVVVCQTIVVDQREVKGPRGYREMRWVIQSKVSLGDDQWTIPLSLTSHDYVRFRMILGRTALQGKYLVDSSQSYLISKGLS